tara:strand:+ start:494 stop:631 length:138 start_codon:yes stop_codon:yes gene_type:complete
MKITDLLNEPKIVVIFAAVIFCTMTFSLAAVLASMVDQASILLST